MPDPKQGPGYAGSAASDTPENPDDKGPTPRIVSKAMIPAVDADTEAVRKILLRMPFAGEQFAPYVRAIEAEPLPPINARGGRDVEGWTAVYEAIVQPSESALVRCVI